MRFPSKFINYKDSSIYKFSFILEELEKLDLSVLALYKKTKKNFQNIQEYMEVLDCLFAMKKIVLIEEVLHYVKNDMVW